MRRTAQCWRSPDFPSRSNSLARWLGDRSSRCCRTDMRRSNTRSRQSRSPISTSATTIPAASERAHQPVPRRTRAAEGIEPDAGEVLEIVEDTWRHRLARYGGGVSRESSTSSGQPTGYLPVDQIEAVAASGSSRIDFRRHRSSPHTSRKLSIAGLLFVPAGRYGARPRRFSLHIDGRCSARRATLLWRTIVDGIALRRGVGALPRRRCSVCRLQGATPSRAANRNFDRFRWRAWCFRRGCSSQAERLDTLRTVTARRCWRRANDQWPTVFPCRRYRLPHTWLLPARSSCSPRRRVRSPVPRERSHAGHGGVSRSLRVAEGA